MAEKSSITILINVKGGSKLMCWQTSDGFFIFQCHALLIDCSSLNDDRLVWPAIFNLKSSNCCPVAYNNVQLLRRRILLISASSHIQIDYLQVVCRRDIPYVKCIPALLIGVWTLMCNFYCNYILFEVGH